MKPKEDLQYCMHTGEPSWEEYDAKGIYLCRVCDRCEAIKLATYRPDVLIDPNYYTDEPVEEST